MLYAFIGLNFKTSSTRLMAFALLRLHSPPTRTRKNAVHSSTELYRGGIDLLLHALDLIITIKKAPRFQCAICSAQSPLNCAQRPWT
mmetsp:Transcript_27946/g.83993  ORF Transcript_27946/g.83993 Transcript_27946/m.83993 type:complete len:87 (+) Transcript_27946:3160-3420(+)